MVKETSYFHHLKFDQKLNNTIVAKYLTNPRLVLLLLVAIIVIGTMSYLNLPRRLNPEIKIPIVIVTTVLPGANPEDVESLVTEPLESGINEVPDIKTVSSTSQENISVVQIEFNSGTDPDKARDDVQAAIDQVTLPEEAQIPQVRKIDFENQPVWTFSVVSNGDVASLNRFAKNLQKELEDLPTVDTVTTRGLEEREISVVIDQSKIATYGISPLSLSSLVKASLGSFPAGVVLTKNSTFALSIDPTVNSIEDVRNLQLNIKGVVIPLSSIATISDRPKPNQFPSFFATSQKRPTRSITFNVFKSGATNIDKAVEDAEKTVAKAIQNYEGQFQIMTIRNTADLITKQFKKLLRDFGITIILVFLVLFIFLGARQAFVSLFAVPLTFFISFSVMNVMGISLNFLSIFSLLLSLGLLVDDTIVVISAMTSYFRTNKFTPLETGLLVFRDFLVPILTTTLTTVWAFLPLLIATGIIGEFIKSIPIVVSSTLLASLGVALLITLPLMIILLRPSIPSRVVIFLRVTLVIFLLGVFIAILPKGPLLPLAILLLFLFLFVTANVRLLLIRNTRRFFVQQKKRSAIVSKAPNIVERGLIRFDRISSFYRQIITKILSTKENRRKAITMVIIFSLFSYLLLPLGFVKNEFFPRSDQEALYVSVELPSGTNTQSSTKEALSLLEELRNIKDVSYVTADIGQTFTQANNPSTAGSNTIFFSLVLFDKSERSQSSIEIAQNLREKYKTYTPGKFTVSEISGGPPAGADIQIKLFGSDLATLDAHAEQVVHYLKKQEGVTDIAKSIKPSTSKIVFVPDNATMAQFNVTADQVGLWLRAFASGFLLDSAKFTGNNEVGEEQDITFRMGSTLQKVSDISSLSLPTFSGIIPLESLGKLKLEASPTLITREDGKRTISVTATVIKGYSIQTINQKLENYAKKELKLPEGYSWKTGGVNEENQRSVNSILQAMILSFLLIIITLVIQFSSFRKAIIVMLVIPLSISGVFIIFALTKTPLSFPALIGLLALFGIVVKNSILIVDKITTNQAIGMKFLDSIVDAGQSRLEPIALTSLATIMGLIPITISDPLWRGLGGAIIAGLTFSGTIMLFFIPVVYYMWFYHDEKKVATQKK